MSSGLDDVVAADTILSEVDGVGGRLIIRGHSLDELTVGASFEDVLWLLLSDFFTDLPPRQQLGAALAQARIKLFERVADIDAALLQMPVTDALRALMSRLTDDDSLAGALRLVAAPAVLMPALVRRRRGEAIVAPDSSTDHATDLLRMLHARVPLPGERAALNTYLVTVSDHGLNASTFVARVVASTRAGLTSCVLSALSALKGPLHGGAPGPVLDMLDQIAQAGSAESWLEQALLRGERLMGFGHRIYRVRDPRADALMAAVRRLDGANGQHAQRLALAQAVEAAAVRVLTRHKPGRALQINVEFYTAVLLEALGIPRDCFTSVFAAGRVAGWIAHAREQARDGRLIRPQSRYVGLRPDQAA